MLLLYVRFKYIIVIIFQVYAVFFFDGMIIKMYIQFLFFLTLPVPIATLD